MVALMASKATIPGAGDSGATPRNSAASKTSKSNAPSPSHLEREAETPGRSHPSRGARSVRALAASHCAQTPNAQLRTGAYSSGHAHRPYRAEHVRITAWLRTKRARFVKSPSPMALLKPLQNGRGPFEEPNPQPSGLLLACCASAFSAKTKLWWTPMFTALRNPKRRHMD